MIGDIYEVYACKYNGEYVYIGSGKHGRHRHCTSGRSHVYELNFCLGSLIDSLETLL